jgi:hypothetical protein
VVAVFVAMMLVVLVGFAALAVDVGVLYNTRAELQRTTDAAALAAAAMLTEYEEGDPIDLARNEAVSYVQRNSVFGRSMDIETDTDVVFGRAYYNDETGTYDFVPGEELPDAVSVRVRHTEGSPNGSIPLYFARVFGMHDTEMTTRAIAIIVPRDIAVVADLSGSHTDDSELSSYADTEVNLHEVWDKFPGGIDTVTDGGNWPDDIDWENIPWDQDIIPAEFLTEEGKNQAVGPAWGYMQKMGYGTEQVDSTYSPTSDDGLIRLAYNTNWSDNQLRSFLFERGYITSEVNAIMSRSYDGSGAWNERVAAALGLAQWSSGHGVDPNTGEQPLWMKEGLSPGNGNNQLGSGELNWTATFGDRSISASTSIWNNYISNYMYTTGTRLYQSNSSFRYRFGVKTFINYLMESRPSHSQTPELAETPHQPMQAVKDAVTVLTGYIDELESEDQVSLEIYGTTALHEVDLTFDYAQVSNRLNEMQAGHYDSWTNMGGGLQRAIEELGSDRARGTSRKTIILLTDGYANVDEYGHTGNETSGAEYAVEKAQEAAALGIRIFAVSVGVNSNQTLMDQIAEIGNGEHLHAEGSIDEYSAQLLQIFVQLGGKRPVELIR